MRFTIESKQLDGSALVITTNKSSANSTNNNNSNNVDKDTIPDTSGITLITKALSIASITGAIVILKKKRK